MIYTNIPYSQSCDKKELGVAYNDFMKILPSENDWACFIDHDAMFTTDRWYDQLNRIITAHPNIGAFGCRTNRIGYAWQMIENLDIDNNDIKYHRDVGEHLMKNHFLQISPGSQKDTRGVYNPSRFSGVLILVKKRTWMDIGGFKESGFLGIDDDFRSRLHKNSIQFAIMDGVYVYHWYRYNSPYKTSEKTLSKLRKKYKHLNCIQKIKNLNNLKIIKTDY